MLSPRTPRRGDAEIEVLDPSQPVDHTDNDLAEDDDDEQSVALGHRGCGPNSKRVVGRTQQVNTTSAIEPTTTAAQTATRPVSSMPERSL
jgi:hypothetical protein